MPPFCSSLYLQGLWIVETWLLLSMGWYSYSQELHWVPELLMFATKVSRETAQAVVPVRLMEYGLERLLCVCVRKIYYT